MAINIKRFANLDSLDNVRSSFASWIGGDLIEELQEEQWKDPVTKALIDRISNAPPIRIQRECHSLHIRRSILSARP